MSKAKSTAPVSRAAKLTKEQVAEARQKWENSPTMTLEVLAAQYGVSPQSLSHHKRKQNWEKKPDLMKIVRESKHAADLRSFQQPVFEMTPPPAAPEGTAQQEKVAASAVDLRAGVIDRHRRELQGARVLIYEAVRMKDIDKARLAKTAAEALKLLQGAERVAYSLDEPPDNDPAESKKILIVRTGETK